MEFLGCPLRPSSGGSWREDPPEAGKAPDRARRQARRGEFRLFEADRACGRQEAEFRNSSPAIAGSLSTGQKLHTESEGVIPQRYRTVHPDFDVTVVNPLPLRNPVHWTG